ncbi:MAG: hypothetical protein QOH82_1576 [Mycobacterium sp.]|jgi:fumarate reductase flavoprotein subunit|nr:hypothetical protein [Mycobacterium sp.]
MTATEEQVFDVVVVGGGGAGLAAAVEAAEAGARTIVLEKCPVVGGTTGRWSVGSISAAGTNVQRRAGIVDTPEGFFADLPLFAEGIEDRDNLALRRVLAEESGHLVDWLADMGVEFFGPFPEPPHSQPRMHNVLPHSGAYSRTLAKEARRRGAQIKTGAWVRELLTDDGRVTGVRVDVEGRTEAYRAARGVILAAGDFSNDPELKREHLGEAAASIAAPNPSSTGDGHKMAVSAGARIVNGDLALGPEVRFIAPARKHLLAYLPPVRPIARLLKIGTRIAPPPIFRRVMMQFLTTNLAPSAGFMQRSGALVDGRGTLIPRGQSVANSIAAAGDAYFILDAAAAQQFSEWPNFVSTAPGIAYAYLPDYRDNRKDVYKSAPTLPELAEAIGANAGELLEAVAAHNENVSGLDGEDAPAPVRSGPFIAVGPARAWIVITDGGLAVTEQMEVTDAAGTPIDGLFAAGSTGQGGVLLECHGTHVGWAMVSGRIAGRAAAAGTAHRFDSTRRNR